MLKTYLDHVQSVVKRFAEMPFVVQSTFDVDLRPGAQAYLTGKFCFVDGTRLHFREYVDATGSSVQKLSYTYHYQTAEHELIFRYDNAQHRPPLEFAEHKHTPEMIIAAEAPSLEAVLLEIVQLQQFNYL